MTTWEKSREEVLDLIVFAVCCLMFILICIWSA
jgi:hypothetical protein